MQSSGRQEQALAGRFRFLTEHSKPFDLLDDRFDWVESQPKFQWEN